MPADVTASGYSWYFDVPEDEKIVRLHWEPEGEFASSMTFGSVAVQMKDPEGTWVDKKAHEGAGVPWVVAQKIAHQNGMNVEVAEHA
jgi:hypothetical protein